MDRSSESHYKQLQSWYLARLRKQALEQHEQNLTPAQLINADRSLIESLVVGSSSTSPSARTEDAQGEVSTYKPQSNFAFIYACFCAGAFFMLLNSLGGSLQETVQAALQLTVFALLFQTNPLPIYEKDCAGAMIFVLLVFPSAVLLKNTLTLHAARWRLPRQELASLVLTSLLALAPALAFVETLPKPGKSMYTDAHCAPVLSMLVWSSILLFLFQILSTSKSSGPQRNASEQADELEKLRRERDELTNRETLIADASPEILLVMDKELRILACNWTIQKVLSYLPEELITRHLTQLILAQDLDSVKNTIINCKAKLQGVTFESRLLTKQKQAVDLRFVLEYSQTNECYFASASDITAEKNLERAKKDFVAMLGHDIKLPVTSSLLWTQVLLQGVHGEFTEPALRSLNDIESSLKRLIGMLEELLEFEQLTSGEIKLNYSVVNIAELLEKSISESQASARKKSIEIVADLDPVSINADPNKLARLFVNLISNAIKFSPAESQIRISSKRNSNTSAEIRVTDDGPGIAPEYQKLIFERYQRLDSTSKEDGSGLGLAIAKAIAVAHNGMIGVESQVGSGSTFWITLPLQ